MLERFLRLVEQPHVLDCDHRLAGESLDQADLGRRERALIADQCDHADGFPLAKHRHCQHRPETNLRLKLAKVRILSFKERDDVLDMHASALQERAADDCRGAQWQDFALRIGPIHAPEACHGVHLPTARKPYPAAFGPTQQAGPLGHRLQYRVHVGRRAADHAQYVRGRSLLLERFLRLIEEAHVLDRDHRLVREGFDQVHLAIGEGPHFAAPDGDDTDQLVFTDHRDRQDGTHVLPLVDIARLWSKVRIAEEIGDMDYPFFEGGHARRSLAARSRA
ncbi:MAG TPA: hypothetical protein VLA73_10705 [Burkholderiales bacterium]|nr:hypothetical protein [Burkholderiales bacterium]